MSLFATVPLNCPACSAAQRFDAVHSVNAERRPDLRLAILDDEFQRLYCSACAAPMRLDPDFTLLDRPQGLWISAAPLAALVDWPAQEARAHEVFDDAFGAGAARGAQAIGRDLRRRLTFGWAALREKVYAADRGLDDVSLELCKLSLLRSGVPAPLQRGVELRLVEAGEQALVFTWMRASDQAVGEALELGRELYDEIDRDAEGRWAGLRERLSSGPFVDINRMLLA